MQDVEKTTDKVELSDTENDPVDGFRKAKRPSGMPQDVWDKMWEAIRKPQQRLGLLEAKINDIPSIIWDTWKHSTVDADEELWSFMERWEIANREVEACNEQALGDEYVSPIGSTRKDLEAFRGIVERFANDEPTASDLEEIVNKFEIKIKLQTARVKGKVEYIELRSYERAVDPEKQKWADENDPHGIVDTRVSPFVFFLYTALYKFLMISQIRLSICAAKDCGELFIQELHGRRRLYHRRACQVREYRRRKKAAS